MKAFTRLQARRCYDSCNSKRPQGPDHKALCLTKRSRWQCTCCPDNTCQVRPAHACTLKPLRSGKQCKAPGVANTSLAMYFQQRGVSMQCSQDVRHVRRVLM